MITRFKKVVFILLLAGSSLLTQAQTRYNLYDLGPIVGTNSSVQCINNNSSLAGYTATNGGFSAISCISNQVSLIPGLSGVDDRAVSINNSNHIVINSLTNGQYYPFLYNDSGLNSLGDWGGTNTFVTGLDDFDDVIGYAESTNGVAAFYYNTQLVSLGDLGGGISYPWGINNLGLIVGSSALPGGPMHACYFTTNGPVDLNVAYASNNITLLSAEAVNNQLAITGWATTNTSIQPFLIDTNGLTLLPIPNGGSNAYSLAINSAETIVGSLDSTNGSRAALWQNGTGYDLNSLVDQSLIANGWSLASAFGLNDIGNIVGVGSYNNNPKSFVLIPNKPPNITITYPTNGAIIPNPGAGMTVIYPTANATDDGCNPTVMFGCDNRYFAAPGSPLGTDFPFLTPGISPGTHTITAIATDNLGASTVATPVNFTVAMYTNGLVCWLKPESLFPGAPLTNWVDASGSGNNATTSISNAPTVLANLVNGYAGVQFNGTNNFLNLPAILAGASGLEAYFVVRAGNGPLWHSGTNYPEGTYSTNAITESAGRYKAVAMRGAPAGFNIYHVQSGQLLINQNVQPGTTWHARINGNMYYQDTNQFSFAFTNICIGRNLVANNTWAYGSPTIVEVLIFKKTFPTETHARSIGRYLNSKYALDTNLPTLLSFTMTASPATPALVNVAWTNTNNVGSYSLVDYGMFFSSQNTFTLNNNDFISTSYQLLARNYVSDYITNIALPQVTYAPAGTTYVPTANNYSLALSSWGGNVSKIVWWMDGAPYYTTTNYPWGITLNSSSIVSHTLIPQAFDSVGNNRFCNSYVVSFINPADTDGDGIPDSTDPYPYDASLTNSIPGLTNTFTAPIITITEP